MELLFDFDERQWLTNVRFSGLDGSESVTSIKDALSLLKIRNPASTPMNTGSEWDGMKIVYPASLDGIVDERQALLNRAMASAA